MKNMRRSISVCALFVVFVLSASAFAQTSQPVFKAGVSRRDITPGEPLPMWGYGARHDALSQGTLDPLFAAAVVTGSVSAWKKIGS